MENAVVRGVPQHPTRLGDHVVVGPHASLTGCVIEGDTRIATGAVVFNGARLDVGAQLEFHAVVYVNTVVPAGVAVPMGWFAGGDPAELVPPSDRERIRELMGPLDYAGTVLGVVGGDGRGARHRPPLHPQPRAAPARPGAPGGPARQAGRRHARRTPAGLGRRGLDGMEVRAGASPHVIVGCRAGVGPGR